MSSAADFDEEAARRDYRAPYSHNHPIPTIQRYREHQNELEESQAQAEAAQHTQEDDSRAKRAFSSVKSIIKNEDKKDAAGDAYPTSNRNSEDAGRDPSQHDSAIPSMPYTSDGRDHTDGQDDDHDGSENQDSKQADDKKGDHGLTATE